MTMKAYTTHITFHADTDAQALEWATKINDLLRDSEIRDRLLHGHTTDSDDYAEQVEADLLCWSCGEPADDRTRIGTGHRYCRSCATAGSTNLYAIAEWSE